MTLVVDHSAYVIDRDGSTRGITAFGEVTLTGEVSGWMRVIASWVEAGDDVHRRAESLDPARADQVWRVQRAMLSLGILRELPVAGRVRFLGEAPAAQRAVRLSGRPLPDVCLAVGPTWGAWLLDDLLAHPEQTYGAVLLRDGGALVLGPAMGADLIPVLVAVQERGSCLGRPDGDVLRQAVAQLVRRVADRPADPWRATSVTTDGSVLTRISAHPWQNVLPASTGVFEERAMTLIDPEYGVIRLIEEADLPQVPLHRARALVACDAVFDRRDVEVVGEGVDFLSARADAVRRALAARAESTLDPRRVLDRTGATVAAPDATLKQLRSAALRVLTAPEDFYVCGHRISDGSRILVPVRIAYRCADDHVSVGHIGVAETAEVALQRALEPLLAHDALESTQSDTRHLNAKKPAPVLDASDPNTVVVTLDHDPAPGHLGFIVRKALVLQ